MPHILSILATLSLFIYVNQLIENGMEGTPAIALAFSLLIGIFSMIRVISKQ